MPPFLEQLYEIPDYQFGNSVAIPVIKRLSKEIVEQWAPGI